MILTYILTFLENIRKVVYFFKENYVYWKKFVWYVLYYSKIILMKF